MSDRAWCGFTDASLPAWLEHYTNLRAATRSEDRRRRYTAKIRSLQAEIARRRNPSLACRFARRLTARVN